jgi:hypothetical protein
MVTITLLDLPLKVAVMVTAVSAFTPAVEITNSGVWYAPAGMVTAEGTVATAGFELDNCTTNPPSGAFAVIATRFPPD